MLLDLLTHDVKQIIRGLVRRPAVPAAVVLTLAVGVGANASIFAIVDRLLLRAPGGVNDASAVQRIYAIGPSDGQRSVRAGFTAREFQDIDASLDERASVAAYLVREARVGSGAEPGTRASAGWITSGYFPLLGAGTAIGRTISDSDGNFGNSSRVAVLSFDYWTHAYQQSPAVLGGEVIVDGQPYTVIGVAEKGFAGIWRTRWRAAPRNSAFASRSELHPHA